MNRKRDPFEYLNSLGMHSVKPGLERISSILRAEGNPHLDTKTVLVAGTNGKTSTATMISAVLTASGFSTGLYTSPHLVHPKERIKINGTAISDSALGRLINRVRRTAETLNLRPSYFEILTAAAFIRFKTEKTDFAVLETGMGGRWDATNTARPLVSVITNVSIDHAQYLGDTEEQIAREKAGIVKETTPLVTAAHGAALGVIEKICAGKKAPVLRNGTEFCHKDSKEGFSYTGSRWKIQNVRTAMKGIFQKTNACVALACSETLAEIGFDIPPERAKKAVEQTHIYARMEYVHNDPLFIIDGAHNPESARCLARSLEKLHGEKRFVFVIGMSDDKDHGGFIKQIAHRSSRLIFTRTGDGKSASPEELIKFTPQNVSSEIAQTPEDALKKALKTALPCCVTGSLYLAGEAKKLIQG